METMVASIKLFEREVPSIEWLQPIRSIGEITTMLAITSITSWKRIIIEVVKK